VGQQFGFFSLKIITYTVCFYASGQKLINVSLHLFSRRAIRSNFYINNEDAFLLICNDVLVHRFYLQFI